MATRQKAPVVALCESPPTPAFNVELLAAMPEETWLNMLTSLEAQVIALLLRSGRAMKERLDGAEVARWCAESRQALLRRRAVRGDMPLGLGVEQAKWTLERVHLCERPPRFPRIYFAFAQDRLDTTALRRLRRVGRLMRKHPSLRIRIEGFADPSAPDEIGRAISQARAVTVRAALLLMLRNSGATEWEDEDPDEGTRAGGVRGRPPGGLDLGAIGISRDALEFYGTRVVGSKVQAIGRWGDRQMRRNRNTLFDRSMERAWGPPVEESSDGERSDSNDMDDGGGFRRVDFTVLGLGDEVWDSTLV